ncbi:hypothetical protein BKA65DRAFT_224582 [Rhexocercosporidium sp. MPI-PUGE-AT-0058]|nr:hypothetical protein BKA65DRAFT_224582 [Rhexocercosporidium sp. MPI-PUGE-AT-0058]
MDAVNVSPAPSRPTLACERCKRRKIKCDRSLPKCQTCLKTSRDCSYPLISNKPGPKPGAHQHKKARHDSASNENVYQRDGRHAPVRVVSEEPTTATSPPYVEQRTERSPSRGVPLSQLLQLSHEPFPQHTTGIPPQGSRSRNHDLVIQSICNAFEISPEMYQQLMNAYFENMTSFSLFHRPSFDDKLSKISSPVQLQALVASMFSFSARFAANTHPPNPRNISPRKFYDLAERLTNNAVKDCDDEVFPLCLLQSLILVNFQQLIEGVRGRAWRSIGTSVRIAYELQLHLVDKPTPTHRNSPDTSFDEEKRRAWWAIWEFDVFASTIRRLPTAIDWKENETWLPIDDELWFANRCVRSCKLDPDPAVAWKLLQNSGNKSPKAWFIVVNSLMRCAHLLSYPQAYSAASSVEAGEVPQGLDILANSLYCLSAALPTEIVYRGEFLKFSPGSLHTDAAKHGIHVMIQLSRFMINHFQVFDSTARKLGEKISPSNSAALTSLDQVAWNHYLNAASEIVSLIRNCPPSHVQHANPFLASTIWLAAAAQVASKSFGSALVDSRVAESNLDVLQTNLNASVSFWGVSDTLKIKLETLERKLKTFAETSRSHSVSTYQPLPPSRVSHGAEEISAHPSHPQAPNLRPPNLWTDANEGYAQNIWADSRLDLVNSSLAPDIDLNLWGWGMDELMNYSGIE